MSLDLAFSTCRICHRWSTPLCADCLARWAPAPVRCGQCATALPVGSTCGRCVASPPAFQRCIVLGDYGFPWDRLITRFKFHEEVELAQPLARALAHRVLDNQAHAGVDGLLPIPLAPARMRDRGYNQAWELARHLGRQLAIPARADLLRRWRDTPPQSGLTRAERERNVLHAFGCEPQAHSWVRDQHWVLVDDVVTTGVTAHAAARTLLTAGARQVDIWALARTPES